MYQGDKCHLPHLQSAIPGDTIAAYGVIPHIHISLMGKKEEHKEL